MTQAALVEPGSCATTRRPARTRQVAEHTTDKKKMNEPSMVLYNNLLSIPPILLLGAVFGEYQVGPWSSVASC